MLSCRAKRNISVLSVAGSINQSEILRFAQNDTMVGFLTHAELALLLPLFRQLLFERLHWLEQVALFFDARQRLIGTKF